MKNVEKIATSVFVFVFFTISCFFFTHILNVLREVMMNDTAKNKL